MAEAYLGDQKRILPCASYVDGKYGLDGLYVGVPTVIGAGGTEEVVEIELSDEEKANLKVSTDAVEELLLRRGRLRLQPVLPRALFERIPGHLFGHVRLRVQASHLLA